MTVGAICPRSNWGPDRLSNGDPSYYSGRSQWLATDVKFSNKDNSVFLISPINNLHAARHKPLYAALEYLISDLIDDWNGVLLYKALARGVSRVKPQLYRCSACSEGAPGMCSCPVNFRESLAWANDRQNNVASDTWHESRWNPILALDGRFASSRRIYDEISLRDGFKERGLQIYVEIVSIELDADGSISADSVHHLCWDLNDPIDGGDARERVSTLAGETESDAGDSEEDDIADFESPMTIAESSGSEGSADEEGEPTGRTGVGGSALNRIRYGPENGTGQGTVGSSVDGIGVGDGNGSQEVHDAAGAAAVLQAENAGEESEEGEDYVDAVYCFTTAGALEAEVVEHPWQGESEQELESLYDDAMSRADEMEPDRVTQ
ncbi:hypothetical protein ISF_05819 [Cordyceps fumosorosea ARSEF 2679]|uniref:DUF4246 domain-containing protein n=1 Tax=Cordyceps fumosorosea (strain ARSEF 2679) TaxID=1081104 RepID=A0A167TNH0_CORFA|nr:hypothetical protein ISF_05819 [Cordyceps fumosorosea ARSEF 2679]OAA60780.1 hypothetical protein ISF_05819 [Cordyceps fumosorosea ARSEF 2679]